MRGAGGHTENFVPPRPGRAAAAATTAKRGGEGQETREHRQLRAWSPLVHDRQDGWGKNGSGWRWQLPAADGENGGAGEAVGKGSVADRDGDVGGGESVARQSALPSGGGAAEAKPTESMRLVRPSVPRENNASVGSA